MHKNRRVKKSQAPYCSIILLGGKLDGGSIDAKGVDMFTRGVNVQTCSIDIGGGKEVKVEGDFSASPILHVLLHLTPNHHKLQKMFKKFAIPKWMPFSNVIVVMLTFTFACYFIPHSSIFVAF